MSLTQSNLVNFSLVLLLSQYTSNLITTMRKIQPQPWSLRIIMLPRTYPFVVQLYRPPRRSPTLRTCPLVVQHAWTPTMNLPAHSSLKCEHGTYEPPRSYPHTRVQKIRTSPLASITHLKSPLRTSSLVTNPAYPWRSHQTHPWKSIYNGPLPLHYRLSLYKRHQAPNTSKPTVLWLSHTSYFNLKYIHLSNYVNLTSYKKVILLVINYIILLFFIYTYIIYVNYSNVKTSQENNKLNFQLHVTNT